MEENGYVITGNKGIVLSSQVEEWEVIRKISSKEELEELIERMPYIQTIQAPNNKVRKEFYKAAMDKYDDLEWVRVIKTVHLRMEEGHYEPFEPDYLEKARGFLYSEISIEFELPFEEVEGFLNETIKKQLDEF